MKNNNYQESLISMLDVIKSDIDALVNVAENAAKDDWDVAAREGKVGHPTTMPLGSPSVVTSMITHSRLTVPLAMVCFSIIDIAGKLMDDKSDKNDIRDKNKNKNDKCESESSMGKDGFLSHAQIYFKRLANRDELNNDTSARRLQDAYRHSIAHAFLPGAASSVGYNIAYTKILEGKTLFYPEGMGRTRTLNVKLLTEITLKGIAKLKNILGEPQDDETLKITILNNFEKLIEDNHHRLSELEKNNGRK